MFDRGLHVSMATRDIPRVISDADVHRSRQGLQQGDIGRELDKGELDRLAKCVVKLEFDTGGKCHFHEAVFPPGQANCRTQKGKATEQASLSTFHPYRLTLC